MRLPTLTLVTRALVQPRALAEARPLSRDDQRDGGDEQDNPDQAHPDRIGAWRPWAPRTFTSSLYLSDYQLPPVCGGSATPAGFIT